MSNRKNKRRPALTLVAAGSKRAAATPPPPAASPDTYEIDLNEMLILNPATTSGINVRGDGEEEGVRGGDFLIVDTSIKPHTGEVGFFDHAATGDFRIGRVQPGDKPTGAIMFIVRRCHSERASLSAVK